MKNKEGLHCRSDVRADLSTTHANVPISGGINAKTSVQFNLSTTLELVIQYIFISFNWVTKRAVLTSRLSSSNNPYSSVL